MASQAQSRNLKILRGGKGGHWGFLYYAQQAILQQVQDERKGMGYPGRQQAERDTAILQQVQDERTRMGYPGCQQLVRTNRDAAKLCRPPGAGEGDN